MPSMSMNLDIGSFLKSAIGTPAFGDTGSTVNGTGIDREGHQSCVLLCQGGAATGSPTGQTANFKIQHDAAVGGSYADYTTPQSGQVGAAAAAAIAEQSADDFLVKLDVNLAGAKRFIRVVSVVALTGGSSPTWPVSSAVLLGPKDEMPAA